VSFIVLLFLFDELNLLYFDQLRFISAQLFVLTPNERSRLAALAAMALKQPLRA
jgi:hypothetical protein